MMNITTMRRFERILYYIAIFFGAGKINPAPGTWGTIFGMVFAIPATIILSRYIENQPIFLLTSLFLVVILFIIGIFACDAHQKITGAKDASEVVIDEVVAILLGMIAIPAFYSYYPCRFDCKIEQFLAMLNIFLLFRFFDITKPFPVSYADKKIKGGLGVMLDDIFAAIYAIIFCYPVTIGMIWIWQKI